MKKSHFNKAVLFVVLLMFAMVPIAQAATTVSLPPTDDAYVHSGNATGNYGSATLYVGDENWNSPAIMTRSYFKFPLGSIPASATITSAKLHLYINQTGNPSSMPVDVHSVSSDTWSEAAITWNTAPSYTAASLDTQVVSNGAQKLWAWDVTSQAILEMAGDGVMSLMIRDPGEITQGQFAGFVSTEESHLGVPTPYLEVIYNDGTTDPVLKFQQLPLDGILNGENEDYFGHDELSTAWSAYNYDVPEDPIPTGYQGCYMADDFADLADTPVIRIKWWGSYLENYNEQGVNRFLIAFESDVPAVGEPGSPDYVPSHPGEVLSTEIVMLNSTGVLNPGEYSEIMLPYNPLRCENLYEYEAVLANPFPERPDTVYWLKIVALVDVDPAMMFAIQTCSAIQGPCDLGRMTWGQIVSLCPDLQPYMDTPLVRWGWHNRDYTIRDQYASVAPNVIPGEHMAGVVTTPYGFDLEVWHFQDDAVQGDMFMDMDLAAPNVQQYDWQEQYYKHIWPLCPIIPPATGIDGPGPEGEGIEKFSKDLAFELYTEGGGPVEPDKDFGDAPEYDATGAATSYPTTLGNDGARHTIVPGVFLGNLVDPELDGQPNLAADGDDIDLLYSSLGDDEDGVVFTSPLIPGQSATVDVTASAPGFLYAWIDFNGDGSWAEAGDQIFIGAALNPTLNNMTFNVPATATGNITTYARFRYITTALAGISYNGLAADGEVEDHQVFIEPGDEPLEKLKFQQLPMNGVTIDNYTYWGHDELSTAYRTEDPPSLFEGCYMADDFADLKETPVIRLKWWGSYIEDPENELGHVSRFLIAFERDVPAVGHPDDDDYVASRPGEVIQSEIVHLGGAAAPLQPGEFSELPFNPTGGPPCFEPLFEYEAVLRNPFQQDPNTVYWLKIVALVDNVDPRLIPTLRNCGLSPCILGQDSWWNIVNNSCPELAELNIRQPLRWGWHNRDYTVKNPYASTPPAVFPGEHNPRSYQNLPPIGSLPDDQVWHFQDDAVSGEVKIDEAAGTEMPLVDQWTWWEQYYKYSLPYCNTDQGVDGPDEIEAYSKDLAFELWTPTECIKNTAPFYADWIAFGEPKCWCYEYQCRGDINGNTEGAGPAGVKRVFNIDLTIFLTAYGVKEPNANPAWGGPGIGSVPGGICADIDHAPEGAGPAGVKRVFNTDLTILLAHYGIKEPNPNPAWGGPGIPPCNASDYNFFVTP